MNEEIDEEAEYMCLEDDLSQVLDTIKQSYEVLYDIETDELCKIYHQLFPSQEGYYTISFAHLDQLNQHIINKTLSDLIDMGLIDMVWMDEANDFGFRLTDAGQKLGDERFGS